MAFTLAESLVASVVLAVAVVAVCSALIASQQQTHSQEDDAAAVSLARQLMEKVASLPLKLPDSTAGWPMVTNPAVYDTIDDFNGYTDVLSLAVLRSTSPGDSAVFNTATPPATAETGAPAELTAGQYRRSVAVTYPTTLFGTTVTAGDFAVTAVTVHGVSGRDVTISRLVAKTNVTR